MPQASGKKPDPQKALSRRPRPAAPRPTPRAKRQTDEEKLDEALQETFPASDPAVTTPRKS